MRSLHPSPVPRPAGGPARLGVVQVWSSTLETGLIHPLSVAVAEGFIHARRRIAEVNLTKHWHRALDAVIGSPRFLRGKDQRVIGRDRTGRIRRFRRRI